MTDNLSDLPPEVLRELRPRRANEDGSRVPDELEARIIAIITDAGGEAGLDTMLIELWRRHRVQQTRRFLNNKIFRMISYGLLFPGSGRKGFYRIRPIREIAPDFAKRERSGAA